MDYKQIKTNSSMNKSVKDNLKLRGDNVEWERMGNKFDLIYASKIFNFTPGIKYKLNCDEVIKGGTGYDIKGKLPEYIENDNADYSIYPNCDYSLQFLSCKNYSEAR